MIRDFQFEDGRYGCTFLAENSFDNFFNLLKIFEKEFLPTEKKCISGWHDVIYEYKLLNSSNIIRFECVDEIVTIMFTEQSEEMSKKELKNIAEFIDNEIQPDRANMP